MIKNNFYFLLVFLFTLCFATTKSFQNPFTIHTQDLLDYQKNITEFKNEFSIYLSNRYAKSKNQIIKTYANNEKLFKSKEMHQRVKALKRHEVFVQAYKQHMDSANILFKMIILEYEHALDSRQFSKYKTYDFQKAINLCVKFESYYPNAKYIDLVIFIRGHCLVQMNRISDATTAFEKLIKTNSQSMYISEAFVRIGEYYFTKRIFSKALHYFKLALPYKHHMFYDRVLYRLGLLYYQSKQYQKALKYFFDILVLANKSSVLTHITDANILKSSTNYIAKSLYKLKNKIDPKKAFLLVKPYPEQFLILMKLGDLYYQNAKFYQARNIYKSLIKFFPTHSQAPMVQDRIIRSYVIQGKTNEAKIEHKRLAILFSQNSEWGKANKSNLQAKLKVENLQKNLHFNSYGFFKELEDHPIEELSKVNFDTYMFNQRHSNVAAVTFDKNFVNKIIHRLGEEPFY